jgi:hypothetical protein
MIEKQIAASFDKVGGYIIINNGLHPDHPKYFSKMIVCTRSVFNAMLNNIKVFEDAAGVRISDGYQKAWKRMRDYHQLKIDIDALANFVVQGDIKAGREQDYIEAEKELAELEKELEEIKEIKNDDRAKTRAVTPAKKRARVNKKLAG